MCLATFTPNDELCEWLRKELHRWAEIPEENLRRRDVLQSIPSDVLQQVKFTKGVGSLLSKAADVCFTADQQRHSVELVSRLYAGIALLVYEIEEAGPDRPATE
jgi:hypothetical protein